MALCKSANTTECLLSERGIPYPPANGDVGAVRELVGECEAFCALEEGVLCPYAEWAKTVEAEEQEYDASSAEAEVAEAKTMSDLMAVEVKVSAAMESAEDTEPWEKVIDESRKRMKSLAEKQGLEEITDSFTDTPVVTESEDGRLLVTGTFARVNIPTANGHVYPQSVWDANEEHIETMLTTGKLVGQDTHPFFGGTKLSEINIVFRKIWQDGDRMRYEGIIPNTRSGEDLQELLDCGVAVELSTRGFGSIEEGEWDGEECGIIQDDYRLYAIDTVMDGAAQDTSVTTLTKPNESTESVGSLEEHGDPTNLAGKAPESENARGGLSKTRQDNTAHGSAKRESDRGRRLPHTVASGATLDYSSFEGCWSTINTKEMDTMRKRVKRMLEAAIRTAGVLGLDEQVEALQAKADALEAIEGDEGEKFDEAIEAAMEAVDKASEAFESKGEDKSDPVDEGKDNELDAKLARMEEISKRMDEREAREARVAARDAKVESLMAEAEDLTDKYEGRLRAALLECDTAEEAEKTYKSLLPTMQEASNVVRDNQFAVHIRRGSETMSLTGEAQERPETVEGVIDALCEGLANESRFTDTGEQNPSNHIWNFRQILHNYAKEHPRYLNSMTREGFERHRMYVENTDTDDVAVGAPYILPIFRRVYPRLIATELCSVQPIDRPDAKAFFFDAQTDSGGARLDVESNFDSTYADHTEAMSNADVKLVVSSASIAAESKSLEATWTTELAQDLQAYHNLNAESELMQVAADEIAREINYTLLEDMRSNASGADRTYKTTKPTDSLYTGREWDQRLADFISRASGDIAGKVYRRPNWIVCDPETASRFTALNTFESAQPDEQNTFSLGVTYEGTLSNRWKVYSDAWFTANTIMLGYKGTDWKDTGYIYLPYIPAYISPMQYDTDTLQASRAVLTRFAKYLVNGDYFGLVNIASGVSDELT